ncbi:MAG TPA: hypothetical protein VMS37_21240 [Verrucomicrobiae bacterium]|nr:hypothetical protein [Verrucomicrobiae bacterium]
MPQLERWDSLPDGVRQHLLERMRDRAISISDLNQLRLWDQERFGVGSVAADLERAEILVPVTVGHFRAHLDPEGKLQKVKPSDQSASAHFSRVVAQRLPMFLAGHQLDVSHARLAI